MGENIYKHISDNGLVTRTYTQLPKLIKKTNNPIFKKRKRFNRPTVKEKWMANMQIKNSSTSLGFRKISMTTTKRNHYIPIGITQLKKRKTKTDNTR